MIPRTLFNADHETFRDSVRRFMAEEVVPHDEKWMEQGYADRDVWLKAGANGYLCTSMPEEYGGSAADRLYSMILMEEQAHANCSSLGISLHSEIVAPYLNRYGSDALKKKYLPKMATGEMQRTNATKRTHCKRADTAGWPMTSNAEYTLLDSPKTPNASASQGSNGLTSDH